MARIKRASTGASPPLVTATISGERSTIAGKITLHSLGASTTLTGIPSAWAWADICALSGSSSVAAMINTTPLKSPDR
ncbi:hypothetical protein D3C84_1007520 [compost metagenome]